MSETTTKESSDAKKTVKQSWRERRNRLLNNDDEEENENKIETSKHKHNNDDDDDDDDDNDDDNYTPYVSNAKRRHIEKMQFIQSKKNKRNASSNDDDNDNNEDDNNNNAELEKDVESKEDEDNEGKTSSAIQKLMEQAENLKTEYAKEEESSSETEEVEEYITYHKDEATKQKEEEERILREASKIQTNALQAKSELAQGFVYKNSLRTTWKVPSYMLNQDESVWRKQRKKWSILVEGYDIPPLMTNFVDMKLPKEIINELNNRSIKRPTPIQMQGLPVALSGRDMVGIAFTGSGKTLTFALPLLMISLEEEVRMPLIGGEGPLGVLLAPSRELARQTYEVLQTYASIITSHNIRCQLLIGGEDPFAQLSTFQNQGVHAVVATPGRLRDFLKRHRINFNICKYICLDEADRMLDLGFDEEVGEIMNYFNHQRQTLLFSATFPTKFREFATETLVQPIIVNVGRAGAANLDVIQEVEYVKQEAKIVYLLECLQKTAPPTIIFCEKKGDVDDVHEYLLLKGVDVESIHGSKDQTDRNKAIDLYKKGLKDVLVATDVAAKGLDFTNIQHVINFDMPDEIENYVHRIGRTGRCGKTGVATTFINKSCSDTTLLDLKHLLMEAKQRIPPVLMVLDDPNANRRNTNANDGNQGGCSFCGGLGHTVLDCPKIDKVAGRIASGQKDAIASTGEGYGGNW